MKKIHHIPQKAPIPMGRDRQVNPCVWCSGDMNGELNHIAESQPLPRRGDLNPGCGPLALRDLQKITVLSQQPGCLGYMSTHTWESANAWISGDYIQMPNSVWRKESMHIPCK